MEATLEQVSVPAVESQFTSKRAFGLFGVFIGVNLLLGVLLGLVYGIYSGYMQQRAGAENVKDVITSQMQAAQPYIAVVISTIVAWVSIRYAYRWSMSHWHSVEGVAWRAPNRQNDYLYAILVGALMGVLVLVVTLYFPMSEPMDNNPLNMFLTNGVGGLLVFAVFAIVIAPISEEVVFRGFMLGALQEKWSVVASVTITSLLFGAIHLQQTWQYWPAIVATFGLGVICAWVRLRTGSLWAAILTHATYNLFPTIGALQTVLNPS